MNLISRKQASLALGVAFKGLTTSTSTKNGRISTPYIKEVIRMIRVKQEGDPRYDPLLYKSLEGMQSFFTDTVCALSHLRAFHLNILTQFLEYFMSQYKSLPYLLYPKNSSHILCLCTYFNTTLIILKNLPIILRISL